MVTLKASNSYDRRSWVGYRPTEGKFEDLRVGLVLIITLGFSL